jgi:hypothetical protein
MRNEEMVFVKRQSQQTFNVATAVGLGSRKLQKGEVGIEIEVEGNKFKKEGVPEPWEYKPDGSLRGKDSAEYVLQRAIPFDDVDKSLDTLWRMFKEYGSVLDNSNRTSVHVHLNVQSFFLNRLTAFMALYFIFEEILTEWCGEHRVGNLFCLRAKDAPSIITQLRRFIRNDMAAGLREGNHYAGLNASAVAKFGSLEFRTLQGVNAPEIIKSWIGILRRLYELSADFPDPRVLIRDLSSVGPLAYFENILGDHVSVVRQGISMTEDELRDSLYEGVRLAQDICYARDWSEFKAVNLQPDPFSRNAKNVAKRLSDGGASDMVPSPDSPLEFQGFEGAADDVVFDDFPQEEDNTLSATEMLQELAQNHVIQQGPPLHWTNNQLHIALNTLNGALNPEPAGDNSDGTIPI